MADIIPATTPLGIVYAWYRADSIIQILGARSRLCCTRQARTRIAQRQLRLTRAEVDKLRGIDPSLISRCASTGSPRMRCRTYRIVVRSVSQLGTCCNANILFYTLAASGYLITAFFMCRVQYNSAIIHLINSKAARLVCVSMQLNDFFCKCNV